MESLIPLFLIRISLSSIRQQMFSTAEPFAKILDGSSAESPYASFFSNNKSLTAFAVLRILMAESFIVLLLCAVAVAAAFVNLLNCAQTYWARVLGLCCFCSHCFYLLIGRYPMLYKVSVSAARIISTPCLIAL